jgi:tetratricopeptide (TPR) repeat protein
MEPRPTPRCRRQIWLEPFPDLDMVFFVPTAANTRFRILLASLTAAPVLAVLMASPVFAQELELKQLPASPAAGPCELVADQLGAIEPGPSDAVTEADRMAEEASQAAILGDQVLARALLREAVTLNPASANLRYRLGRILEDGGDQAAALQEYCAYLSLAPEGNDAAEVEGRLSQMPEMVEHQNRAEARGAFTLGLEAFDRSDYEGAALQFSRALILLPDWEIAHFNRGLSYLAAGRSGAGTADLEWYLELNPDASDRLAVEARIQSAQGPAAPTYAAGTALVSGLVVPGMGHFYSGRPMMGAVVLAAAGGSAATGLLYKDIEVLCLSPTVDGQCPPGREAERTETRPYLVPGLAAAGVITVLGALHAFRGARSSQGPSFALTSGGGIEVPLSVSGVTSHLRIDPVHGPRPGVLRASAGIRF